MDDLLRGEGPLEIHKTGPSEYRASVDLPLDADGMFARSCMSDSCSPGYFKVQPGTGIQGSDDPRLFCPYCRTTAGFSDFATSDQREYAKRLVERSATDGIERMIKKSLGLGPTGKRKLGGGMFSMEMSLKSGPRPPVVPPVEESLRRDVTCPDCGLHHSVFGLAVWCPDCGLDIFPSHLDAELAALTAVLDHLGSRGEQLGARAAVRDVENTLEDLVSIYEAALKLITRRHLGAQQMSETDIDKVLGKIGNAFQNVRRAGGVFSDHTGENLYALLKASDLDFLALVFEKRHPVTHNLGVIDRKYLQRARTGELEGREIRVGEQEIRHAIGLVRGILHSAYHRLFPKAAASSVSDGHASTAGEGIATPPTVARAHGTGLSDPAFAVASLLVRDSDYGHSFHPSYSKAELTDKTGLPSDEVEEAVDELLERNLLAEGRWRTSQPVACPTTDLYYKLDSVVMGWNAEDDAKTLVRLLAECGKPMTPDEFDQRLGWGIRRMNPGCCYVRDMRWADTRTYHSSSHYEVSQLSPSVTTRRIAKALPPSV